MSPRPPLRLVPRRDDRAAAEAALVEAVLTGLPPGGRVLVAGADDGVAAWLDTALAVVEVQTVCSPLPARDRCDTEPLFSPRPADDGFDAVVVDAPSLGTGAVPALAALGEVLAPGGRLLVQAPPDGERSVGAWVRLLGAAGLVLRDIHEPEQGGLAGSIFVAEPEHPTGGCGW